MSSEATTNDRETASPVEQLVRTPTVPGFWWTKQIPPHHPDKVVLVEVFKPMWVATDRTDLRWRYLDGTGGGDSRYDVTAVDRPWFQSKPPESF